jgi:hypothetical protein
VIPPSLLLSERLGSEHQHSCSLFGRAMTSGSDPVSAQTFAEQIRRGMARKGWSVSETARQAARLLPDGQRLARVHVWHYVQGQAFPHPQHMTALLQALDLE